MSETASSAPFMPPRRRETFLARYPRKLKLAVTAGILLLLTLPPVGIHLWIHHRPSQKNQDKIVAETDEPKQTIPEPLPEQSMSIDLHATPVNDQNDPSIKLVAAPDSRVTEETPTGSLPKRSETGLAPWQVYARPFDPIDRRPRIAIVVADLGYGKVLTDRAIDTLPPTVTLALRAQSPVVGAWVARARQVGHEILLQIPMEPFDYPNSDPGPDTLLTSLPNEDNLLRLKNMMTRATGYVGITTLSGARMATNARKYDPILQQMRERGLLILDARAAPHSIVADLATAAHVPVARTAQRLGSDLRPDEIDEALVYLERTAARAGSAVGVVEATPLVLAHLQEWSKTLPQRGFALAPVSAVVQ